MPTEVREGPQRLDWIKALVFFVYKIGRIAQALLRYEMLATAKLPKSAAVDVVMVDEHLEIAMVPMFLV